MANGERPERVREESGDHRPTKYLAKDQRGPSWAAVGVFLAGFFGFMAMGFMLGVAWAVYETRLQLRSLEGRHEALRWAIVDYGINVAPEGERRDEPKEGAP